MASIRRRKDRGNRFELHYVDIDGTRIRIDTGTTSKPVANLWKQKADELLSQAKLGLIPKVGRIDLGTVTGKKEKEEKEKTLTLSQFKKKYEDRCKTDLEVSQSTIDNNNYAIQSLINVLGNKKITELTDEDILKWKQSLNKDINESIIEYINH